ncbi:MAG: radical SAM family heme chaperone HemW [Clostridiales bacterium]|nr:radical SAM family heme chaperone HemW [Clostridiales bacterium]
MDKYGIYIHIPFCKARCSYCAFSSCTDYSLAPKYFAKQYAEIEQFRDMGSEISTIYLGGGTPSSVEIKYLDGLFEKLNDNFDLSKVSETTVECNPESVTDELLFCLKRNGVNRLSFGLQSVNDETLKRIGRLHSYADFCRALNLAKRRGFDNVNADLIVGLPETADDFRRSVDTVAKLPLQHVSVYALELHEDTPLYELCQAKYPHNDDELADLYDYARTALGQNRYMGYEISNFAQVGRECKHNLNYWQEGRYFAFGASASGFVGDTRYVNPHSIAEYIATPVDKLHDENETLSISEQANEFVMLGLRLSSGVNLEEFAERYGSDFFDFFPNARKLIRQGFLCVESGRVTVPTSQIYVINSILCELLTFE